MQARLHEVPGPRIGEALAEIETHCADAGLAALVGDVVSFVDSIGEQVGVVGHSSSLALAAAAGTDAISAVAVHEPAVPAVAGQEDPRPGRAVERCSAGLLRGERSLPRR